MFENLVDAVAIVSGLLGCLFGWLSLMSNRRDAIKGFFEADDMTDLRTARKEVYNYSGTDDEELFGDENFAKVCSHYHFYGYMLKKHYIPKSVFKGANAEAVVRCYEKSARYIRLRRENGNKYYAYYFEWLYDQVKEYSWQL